MDLTEDTEFITLVQAEGRFQFPHKFPHKCQEMHTAGLLISRFGLRQQDSGKLKWFFVEKKKDFNPSTLLR